MKKILKLIIRDFSLLSLVALAGCSVYSEKFDCTPGAGVGCQALHKVDARVDEKTLPFQLEEEAEAQSQKNSSKQEILETQILPNSGPISLVQKEEQIMRLPEEALKIWIAPYEDERGQFHEASVVHVVIKSGQWVKR